MTPAAGSRNPSAPLSYSRAGVDTARAAAAVAALAPIARSTYRPEVLGDIGAFAAVTALPSGYADPVLVTANDGAGTKTLIAAALGRFDTIGIDVVAMCVDDVATLGAEPLLFQDQITMGVVDTAVVSRIVEGLAAGCRTAGCALTGGEIAEHPDAMAPGEFDVCGFAVGVAERDRLPQPLTGEPAVLVGLASTGLRCNGLSLARRALLGDCDGAGAPARIAERLAQPAPGDAAGTLGDELLRPSVVYAPAVVELFRECDALAAAHITGGGIVVNLGRVLSPSADAVVRRGSWPQPPVFAEIARAGPVEPAEMENVFNLGVGMVVAVPGDAAAAAAVAVARRHGHDAWPIGEVVPGTGRARLVDASAGR